jgi:hypothetical protein
MEADLKNALITLVQFIVKLKPHHVDAALDEIDIADEAFDEELQVVKDAIGWEDEEDEEE